MFLQILVALLTVALCAFIGREVMNWGGDQRNDVITRRKTAQVLVSAFDNVGLHKVADFLGDYVIGDYFTMYDKIHNLAIAVKAMGADALMSEAEGIFKKVLNAKLATSEGRAWLSALLVEAQPVPPAPEPPAVAK